MRGAALLARWILPGCSHAKESLLLSDDLDLWRESGALDTDSSLKLLNHLFDLKLTPQDQGVLVFSIFHFFRDSSALVKKTFLKPSAASKNDSNLCSFQARATQHFKVIPEKMFRTCFILSENSDKCRKLSSYNSVGSPQAR